MTNKKEKRKVPDLRFPEFNGEWEEKSIECCFKFYDNLRKPVTSSKRKKGIYPYYGATGVIDYVDDYIFDGEYLLIGEDGANIVSRNSPLIYHVKGKMWINNHAHVLVPKNKMFKFFKNSLDKVNYIPYNTGTAQPKLNIESLKKIPLYVPNNDEQQKIGEFFSKLDRQIELEEKKLALLEEQKKGYMQKIFSQELRFKDEKGEEYPEWELKSISEISSVITKGTTPKNYDNNGGVNFIKVESIDETGEIVITSKIDYHTHVNDLKRSILKPGDILFSIAGSIGKTIIIKEENLPANTNQALAIIRIDNENIQYINYFLISKKNKILKENISTIGAQPNLSLKQISNIKIDLPCNLEKQIISQFFYKLESKIKAQTNKVVKYKERKVSLISKIFI
ncbi:restriction endonuclease subunit S [Macrococcus caseolyticus]|uniref:restriction endonuclease subunit S n=1 Tax=Macrococcoides caseolyticum TaxID=69966 RepID=UPI0024BBFA91|nr:restriction endonuclease subunit S [Macrococcus caseolyticus]MDJ1154882.1 restriction endonuclease subunit S [Macrococcus caseolyticus]